MTPTSLRNVQPYCLLDNPPIQKSIFVLHIFTFLVSRDTFVSTKIVLKVDYLELDFERDHLAEKSYQTKMGQKKNCALPRYLQILICCFSGLSKNYCLLTIDGADLSFFEGV
jgi:hypothetical protein